LHYIFAAAEATDLRRLPGLD